MTTDAQTQTKPMSESAQVALCIADQLHEMSYGICHNAAIELRRLVPFEAWYEESVDEINRLRAHVEALTARNHDLSDMIERLCTGLEYYRNTEPWSEADEEALIEAREMAAGLDQQAGDQALTRPAVPDAALRAEALNLANILLGMTEGSSPEPEELWADDYQPADGDVYVHRAALVLELLAAAPQPEAVTTAPCKGLMCGCTDGLSHSLECQAEHSAAIAGGRFIKDAAPQPEAPQQADTPALMRLPVRTMSAPDADNGEGGHPRYLQASDQHLLHRFIETSDDAESYDIGQDAVKRLADLGVIRHCGFGRYAVTMFGHWVHEHHWHQKPPLPLMTNADRDARQKARISSASNADRNGSE